MSWSVTVQHFVARVIFCKPNIVIFRGIWLRKFVICIWVGLVCWSLTSLCHSNGHIETMSAREINPFTALTRIRSQFLRTQWSTSNHQRVDTTTPQTAQPSGLAQDLWGLAKWIEEKIHELAQNAIFHHLYSHSVILAHKKCGRTSNMPIFIMFLCKLKRSSRVFAQLTGHSHFSIYSCNSWICNWGTYKYLVQTIYIMLQVILVFFL